jgi:hypothetical protein
MKKCLNNREWFNLFIIGFLSLVSIFPSVYYLAYGYIPDFWLRESGLYETVGAAACFIAGLLNIGSFRLLLKQERNLNSLWFLLLAVTCLFIAGEEISWGQHFFDFEVPSSIASTNFQKEFNLHNSTFIQSSNNSLSSVFFKLLMLYFIILPMLLVAFPTLECWARRMMIPIPSMLVAIIGLLAKTGSSFNYKIVYGSSFQSDNLHLGEGLESIFELCLLIFSFELFFYVKNKTHQYYNASTSV